jgi:hypothetical protein
MNWVWDLLERRRERRAAREYARIINTPMSLATALAIRNAEVAGDAPRRTVKRTEQP